MRAFLKVIQQQYFAVLLLSCLFIPPPSLISMILKPHHHFLLFLLFSLLSHVLWGISYSIIMSVNSVHDTMCQAVGLVIQRATGNTLGKMDPGYSETSLWGQERMALPRSLCSSYLFSAPSRLFLSFLTLPVPTLLIFFLYVRRRSGFIITHRKFWSSFTYTHIYSTQKIKKKKHLVSLFKKKANILQFFAI